MRLLKFWMASIRGGIVLLAINACSTPDAPTSPFLDRATYIEVLSIREKAITLSLLEGRNTARLNVTALFGDGSVVTEPIQFTSIDPAVTVDSTGLITAKFLPSGGLTFVRVSVTHKGFTRKDSVQIRVLERAPTVPFHSLDFRIPDGASSTIPVLTAPSVTSFAQGGFLALVLRPLGEDLTPVPSNEILVSVRSSDTTIARVDQTGLVTAGKPGVVVISVNMLANGVFVADSLTIRIGLPQYIQYLVPAPSFNSTGNWVLSGDTARIAAGGVVVFVSNEYTSVDLIFDNPEYAEAAQPTPSHPVTGPGNITAFHLVPLLPDWSNIYEHFFSGLVARKFSVPGVYPFHGVMSDPKIKNNMHGVIIVCPPEAMECDP